ncbi:MAG: hypothetical protein QG650_117, partial [Patescibacteria group bacterium]|nr:hypothetical protein [Patescibacteria group bacterium]
MTFCEWISDSPFGILKIFFHDPRVGVFSYLWILSIQTVAFAAFGRHSFAILSFAFGTVAYVNAQKIATLGEPLYPTDVFVHVSALGNLAGFSGTFQSAEIYVLTAGAALIGTGGYLLSDGISPTFRKRALAFFGIGAAQFLIATGAFGALSGIQAVAGLSPEDYSWRQVENYQKNGLVGGLFTNLGNIAIRQPEGYSKETVARIRGSVPKPEASPSPFRISGTEGKKPNVIVILSESFWDVTQLDGVKIEPNPIANFESVGQEIGTGRMISPMFGGKTALVEFEILTGN